MKHFDDDLVRTLRIGIPGPFPRCTFTGFDGYMYAENTAASQQSANLEALHTCINLQKEAWTS